MFVRTLVPALIFCCVLFLLDIKGPIASHKCLADAQGLHLDIKNILIAFCLIPVTLFHCCLYKSHLLGLLLSFKCLFVIILHLYICFLRSEFIYGT